MYKRASRNLQHAHRVDLIHPGRGYIGTADDTDALPPASSLSDEHLAAERKSLQRENVRWMAEQQVARATNDERRAVSIGATLSSIQARVSVINAEVKARNIARNTREDFEFKRLLRAEVGDERFLELAEAARLVVRSAVAA